ncbi:uncharacterized protein LOC133921396 isoform X2 [Phragmites australis]|uniref:uncharacterized protein LOC133921396 isoform X2 n=1 Tax=Phragmites australis TaxID=29695 RepID=UPI002D7688BB|nr:uncharacterized protein LOC133921396 isoform X2 [Phragmites australis]
MEDQDKSDGWDEVLEEADELACVHKDPLSTSLLSSGTKRRSKSEKKPTFSIRGYGFVALDVKTENSCLGEQEGTSGVPPTKASETMVAERLENIEEETEDLPQEFVIPTKKANTSVSELLEDLQGRSGSSVRTQSSLNQHTPNIGIREQEASSGAPSTKASQTLKAELLGNIKDETEDPTSEFARPTKKANISVAELLEDLQGRSDSSIGTASLLHQHIRAKDWKPKPPASGKKTLAILGERSLVSEDPLEHVIDGSSSEEEEVIQNYLTLVNKDVKRQTMTDLFQEVFNPINMEGTMLPMRSTGVGYYGRMQQIMQMEKDRHAEFLKQYNRGDSKGITVQIMSRSLEGKLTVCRCLFQEMSNHFAAPMFSWHLCFMQFTSTDHTMYESGTKRTIIFSPKICDNVDLLVGNIIHIFPPWKEVGVQDENVILCTYFSHNGP